MRGPRNDARLPDIIHHEHRALSAMLRTIVLLLAEHRRRGTLPDFDALHAMLFYVDEFPEKLHHTSLSQYNIKPSPYASDMIVSGFWGSSRQTDLLHMRTNAAQAL